MSTRGRKPELRVIEGGSMDTDRTASTEMMVPDHIPPAMHGEWLAVVDDLKRRQMLTDAMFGTVDAYVMALWNSRKAQEALDRDGPTVRDRYGDIKQNPAATILGKAQQTVLRLSAELGLTPASRSRKRMKEEEGGGEDDMPDLFDV